MRDPDGHLIELVESLADDQASARTWLVVAQSRRNRGHAEAALEALEKEQRTQPRPAKPTAAPPDPS